ncbi:MAG: branched-chain amino acid ABC transporter permease [Dehalococcoidales bacterium]|nr:branched-chain amino acid ABC transporter permease [Dehalococcoidales bacterium]
MGGIYALIAMGLSLQYGVARVLNISHGEFIMVGAFLTWLLYTTLGINPLIALVIVGPAVFLIGYLLHRTLFRSLLKSSASTAVFEGNSLLATFGLLYIIQNIAIIIWSTSSRGYTFLATPVDLGGAIFSTNRLVTLGFALAIGLAFYLFLARTRTGKAIRAAAQDPSAAELMGVDINRVLALCFGFGALMAGLAGVLYSMCFSIQTTMGLGFTVIAVIVVVLGGLGSIPGSFIGGFILGILGQIVTHFEPSLSLAAYYLIFILLLLLRPKGIFGK